MNSFFSFPSLVSTLRVGPHSQLPMLNLWLYPRYSEPQNPPKKYSLVFARARGLFSEHRHLLTPCRNQRLSANVIRDGRAMGCILRGLLVTEFRSLPTEYQRVTHLRLKQKWRCSLQQHVAGNWQNDLAMSGFSVSPQCVLDPARCLLDVWM